MSDTPFNAKNGIIANSGFTANSTLVRLGSNVSVNTSAFVVGNSSVNSVLNSNTLILNSSNGYLFVNYDQIAATNNALYIQNVGAALGLYLSAANANTNVLGNLNVNQNVVISGGMTISGSANATAFSAIGASGSINVYDRVPNTAGLGVIYRQSGISRLWDNGDAIQWTSANVNILPTTVIGSNTNQTHTIMGGLNITGPGGTNSFNGNQINNTNGLYVQYAGGTLNLCNAGGSIVANGSFNTTKSIVGNQLISNTNVVANTLNAQFIAPGYMHYSDGSNYYILLTGNNTPTATYNGLRPFFISLSNGLVQMSNGLNVTSGLTADSATVTSTLGVGSNLSISAASAGAAGSVNKINMFGGVYGFGISSGSLDHISGGAHSFYSSGSFLGQLTSSGFTLPSSGSYVWTGANYALTGASLQAAVAEFYYGVTSGSLTLNFQNGFNSCVSLNGAITFNAPVNFVAGHTYILRIAQDGTGGRTASWASCFDWGKAGTPTLSTGAGQQDVVFMYCVPNGANPLFYCTISQGF